MEMQPNQKYRKSYIEIYKELTWSDWPAYKY